ncbi:hypothetical protein [Streptomyces yangpuensis]|uniref:hypothetical protein n=1 Tax=Streptomyces yangpuensis TaxID=1648182 RepID=UPI0036596620
MAEYDAPVGELLWRATLTADTPIPLLQAITDHLDHPVPAPRTEPHMPLHEAGWSALSHPARTTWQAPRPPGRADHYRSRHHRGAAPCPTTPASRLPAAGLPCPTPAPRPLNAGRQGRPGSRTPAVIRSTGRVSPDRGPTCTPRHPSAPAQQPKSRRS